MLSILQTYSKSIDLLDPKAEDINHDDIALALSRIPRFNGHTDRIYSVAEHSCLIYEYLKEHGGSLEEQIIALLHDAREAYIGDLTFPFIQAMIRLNPEFKEAFELLGASVDKAIYESFALGHLLGAEFEAQRARVKRLDLMILQAERTALFSIWIPWSMDQAQPPILPLAHPIEKKSDRDWAYWYRAWLYAMKNTIKSIKERDSETPKVSPQSNEP